MLLSVVYDAYKDQIEEYMSQQIVGGVVDAPRNRLHNDTDSIGSELGDVKRIYILRSGNIFYWFSKEDYDGFIKEHGKNLYTNAKLTEQELRSLKDFFDVSKDPIEVIHAIFTEEHIHAIRDPEDTSLTSLSTFVGGYIDDEKLGLLKHKRYLATFVQRLSDMNSNNSTLLDSIKLTTFDTLSTYISRLVSVINDMPLDQQKVLKNEISLIIGSRLDRDDGGEAQFQDNDDQFQDDDDDDNDDNDDDDTDYDQ
jgi:hypothetical protein